MRKDQYGCMKPRFLQVGKGEGLVLKPKPTLGENHDRYHVTRDGLNDGSCLPSCHRANGTFVRRGKGGGRGKGRGKGKRNAEA